MKSTVKNAPKVIVQVESRFISEESKPDEQYYIFEYTVTVKNHSQLPAKLMSRHWIITNQFGQTEEVRGPGVVGQQPVIMPGQEFVYSSFCPLPTPTGSMRGTYQMSLDDGTLFTAEVPQFYLVEPNSYH